MAPPAESYPDSVFAEGHVIADKYRVERVLGRGGMGMVLAATDLNLERPVAIKVMLPGRESDPEGIQRFLREGRAAVKLTSDHVAKIFEVGLDQGIPFLVMEYLDGQDLGAALARRGKIGAAEAADYVMQACEAIAEAHAAGVIHRDLKPQNLFLARRPQGRIVVKVLDFGISKVTRTDPAQLTRSGAVLGTPLYMAPEQMRSARKADPRTDIWALGVVLYELVTGKPPFLGETIPEMALRIAEEQPRAPRSESPDLPETFERIILRCLRKKPADRYPSVEALAADLRPFVAREALGPPSGPAASAGQAPGHEGPTLAASAASDPQGRGRGVRTDASWGRTADAPRSRQRGRTVLTGSLVVALAGAAAAAGYLTLHSRPHQATALSVPPGAADALAAPPSAPAAETLPALTPPASEPIPSASSAPSPPPAPAAAHVEAPRPAASARPPMHHAAHAPETPSPTVDPGSVR